MIYRLIQIQIYIFSSEKISNFFSKCDLTRTRRTKSQYQPETDPKPKKLKSNRPATK